MDPLFTHRFFWRGKNTYNPSELNLLGILLPKIREGGGTDVFNHEKYETTRKRHFFVCFALLSRRINASRDDLSPAQGKSTEKRKGAKTQGRREGRTASERWTSPSRI